MKRATPLVVLVLALCVPVMAAAQPVQTHAVLGELPGTLTFVPYGPGLFDVNTLGVASGTVTGLGLTNLFTFHQPTEAGTVVNGRFFLIAANGDRISGEYEGTTAWPEPELMIGTATWVITGGTGRFQNASGSIDMTVYITVLGFDTFEWPARWVIDGSIDY